MAFWTGFEKQANEEEAKPSTHKLRRMLVGTPISAAIGAPKGQKMKAYGEASKHVLKKMAPPALAGGAGGAVAGALASLLSRGRVRARHGAAIGGAAGATLGGTGGAAQGHFGREADEIHQRWTQKA